MASFLKGEQKKIFLILILFFLIPIHALYPQQISRISMELFKTGVSHFNKTEYEASIDFFQKAIKEDPNNNKAHYFLALAYYKAGFEENAILELNYLINNGFADDVTKNLENFISRKPQFFKKARKSKDYSEGISVEEGNLGKYTLSKATGIWIDNESNIYLATFGSKLALKISPNGKPLFNFTSPKISPGRLYDIVISKKGIVYISDFTNDQIYMFKKDGKYIGSFGKSGSKNGEFYGPTALALDNRGYIYVVDSGNIRIQKFTENGDFILSFGHEGDEDGLFYRPSGIAVDKNGYIYVSDHKKKKIFIYDRNGNYITYLKGINLKDPYGLFITSNNFLLIADNTRVISYDLMHSSYDIIEEPLKVSRIMDVAQDYLGQIYICTFEDKLLAQLIPKPDKYRNLNVIIDRVDISSYPAISYTISVYDADGVPIYGLEDKNFTLRMGGTRVRKIDLSYNSLRESKNVILFLVEKSTTMEEYRQDIEKYLYDIVSTVRPEDEMMVIGYNNKSWVASSFTNSRLRTMDAINENSYDTGNKFDTAFRRAIDYLNKRFYRKSLIYITDGQFDDSSFSTYSLENCIAYAANNQIPVYIINFTENSKKRLEYLARITGGKYYNVYNSPDLPYIYTRINNYTVPNYFIFFNDVYDPKLKNLFIESEAEVYINGRSGKGKSGFIYP